MRTQIIFLAVGVVIGLFLSQQCNRRIGGTNTIYSTDTLVVEKWNDAEFIQPYPALSIPTSEISQTFTTLEVCQSKFDTLFIEHNDTNIYNIDTLNFKAEFKVAQNRLFYGKYSVKETTKTIEVNKQRFQLLLSGGLSYPIGAHVGVAVRLKNGTITQYNYSTLDIHSIGVMIPIRFKK